MAMIMKTLCLFFIVLASFATLFSVADARRFYVGGNGVWGANPQENYKTWAERNRFQVNDTLYFKYPKGSNSVQQVMKADFDGCNVKNPIKHFDNGETEVTLDRSGPFFFVSGNEDLCKKGQKLVVVVLAVRNHTSGPISPAKPPSSAQSPKSPSPVSPVAPAKPPTKSQPPKSSVSPTQAPKSSVSPAQPPKSSVSPTHAPKSPSPVSPSHAPAKAPATPSPSPKSSSPTSHSPAISPSHAPANPPSTQSSSPASSPSSSQTPSNPPKSSPADQAPTSQPPEQTPPSTPSPSDSTPASDNATAPAPSPKNSASDKSVTSVMATVLTVAFTVFMLA